MPMKLRSRTLAEKRAEEKVVKAREEESDEDQGNSDSEFEMIDPDLEQPLLVNSASSKPDVKGDRMNIAVLLFLYILQGIPLGLAGAVPLILTNRHVSYKEQAEFSFAFWPFSIKLLWAPIVDSCYISSFGRRKTWLVPVQYLIGVTMLLLSQNVKYYLGEEPEGPQSPQVYSLMVMFFFLNFLAATQDIAVDGWALTMLKPENVGFASTCNSVGQTAGYFLGYVGFIALETYQLVTFSGFLFFWGVVFMLATTLVAIFKGEKPVETYLVNKSDDEEPELGVVETYTLLYKILRLSLMPITIFVLLTCKIGFSATDSVTTLKFVENGVPKDKLALLSIPMIPLQILLPWVISRYTAGPRPMNVFLKAFPARLIMGLVIAWAVWVTPSFQEADGQFPIHFYAMIVGIYMLHQVCLYSMFVAVMAFFARISDPAVGGTYMTLLNTVTNLGGNWPATLALWCVDAITLKECSGLAQGQSAANFSRCDGAEQTKLCEDAGGKCEVIQEGYFIETIGCVIFGFIWLSWGWGTIKRLQAADVHDWRVVKRKTPKERA